MWDAGATVFKFSVSFRYWRSYMGMAQDPSIRSLTDLATRQPTIREVRLGGGVGVQVGVRGKSASKSQQVVG